MSILLGPFDSSEETSKAKDEDLLVFGYACKLYRDDAKALMEDSGQLLIPWMGDSSLMVDRYDVRNKLDDMSQFGLKPNIARPVSNEELDLEDELDKERYLALEWDEIRVEEEEEMEKRKRHSVYSAIEYKYKPSSLPSKHDEESWNGVPLHYNLYQPQHPSTATIDHGSDKFVPRAGLTFPDGMLLPSTSKLDSIIERTASFVVKQGMQMEIIIKAKQKFNPYFSFLDQEDSLYPYYKHIKDIIAKGVYVPEGKYPVNKSPDEEKERNQNRSETVVERSEQDKEATKVEPAANAISADDSTEEESDSDESDDGDGYLHPLLRGFTPLKATTVTNSKSSKITPATSSAVVATGNNTTRTNDSKDEKRALNQILSLQTSASFMARSRAVNSAPSMVVTTEGQVTRAYDNPTVTDPVAAYEYYRQQYYANVQEAASSRAGEIGVSGYGDSSHPSYDGYDQPHPNGAYHEHHPPGAAGGPPGSYYYHPPMEGVPPPDICAIIDKTAEYVAKNSEDFEHTVLERHLNDPRFGFLNPWDPYHAYYNTMKHYCRSMVEVEAATTNKEDACQIPNMQKLNSTGAVSFKLQSSRSSSSSAVKQPLLCGFVEEEVDMSGFVEEEVDKVIDQNSSSPPPKKQKLNEMAEMGSTVQVFLSTVKGMLTNQTNT